MEDRVSFRVQQVMGLTGFYGSPVARLTGNRSSIAGFRISGRRFVSGSPEFVNGGSGPHGFTNRPGFLSRGLAGCGSRARRKSAPLASPASIHGGSDLPWLRVVRFHLRLPLSLSLSLCLSLSLSRISSL
jgi:hypothetical protein